MAQYYFHKNQFVGHTKPKKKGDPEALSYPSVSTIIGQLDKSAALIPWAQRILTEYIKDHIDDIKTLEGYRLDDFLNNAAKAADKLKKEAGKYGTDLHDILEKAVKGLDIHTICKDDVDFYESITNWLEKIDTTSLESEKKLVCQKLGFAGCADLYDPKNHILYDLKTSKAIYDSHILQMSGYAIALESMGFYVDKINIIHWNKEDLTLSIVDVTEKAFKKKVAFKKLVEFYYASANRRVDNLMTRDAVYHATA